MKKLILFISSIVLFCFNATYGSDRYWVNGSGSWNNPSHWSENSGGIAGAAIPTLNDNVYFDNNSFNGENSTVTLNVNASCKNFIWNGSALNNTLSGGPFISLNIYGSFILEDKINNEFAGKINLNSNDPSNVLLVNIRLLSDIFIKGSGNWDLYCDLVTSGTLNPATSQINKGNYHIYASNYSDVTFIKPNLGPKLKAGVLTVHFTVVQETCNGSCDGSVTAVITGGTLPYVNIQWYDNFGTPIAGATSATLSGQCAGRYLISVDDSGLPIPDNVSGDTTLSSAPAIVITGVPKVDITCFGANDGVIQVNALGGTGLKQYSVDFGSTYQANKRFNGLLAGNYNIVVKDATGCLKTYATNPVAIVEPPVLAITSVVKTDNTSCFGDNLGTITVTAGGGTGAITYSDDNGTTYQAGAVFNSLIAGNYNIKVKDINNCETTYGSNPVAISQPTQISITSVVKVDVTGCNGNNNGSITVTASGGTGVLTYSNDNGATYQASNIFNTLVAGNYNIRVKDANNCVATYASNPVVVGQPTAVSITSVVKTDVTCNGGNDGTITVTASGGTGALTYSNDNGVTYQASNIFNALVAGNYNIRVKDVNNCVATYATNPIVIAQPSVISITSVVKTDVTCNGGNNGSITITASGGTGALSYSTDNGGTYQAGNAFLTLVAASYNVRVRDASNCVVTYATNPVVITQPSAVSITSVVKTDVTTCNGGNNGTITVTASGGTGALTYSNDNGVTYQAGNLFNTLIAGNYNVRVKDASNCVATYATNPVVITQPTVVSITSVVKTDVTTCNGGNNGTITITASGGTGALNYSTDNGATYQVGNLFNTLIAGNYNVRVRDANNCVATYASNPVVIGQPTAVLISSVVKTDVTTCNGGNNGTITITASGGTGAITYSSDNGATYQVGNIFNTLVAGNYNVRVKDANNCVTTYATNPVIVGEPSAVSITSVLKTDVTTCNGGNNGTITITASGGTGVITYSSDNGATYQPGNAFLTLVAGNYNVRVKDANNCVTTYATNPVVIGQPTVVSITSVVKTDVLCNSGSTGTITITASGGTGALTYSTDNGGTYQAGNLFNTLTAGSYNIKVKDANNCETTYATNPVVIAQPTALSITSVVKVDATCNGVNDGSITITASGGTGAITYSTDNGVTYQASNIFNALAASNYNIMVKDANNCVTTYATNPVVIAGPSSISITSVVKTNISCNGGNDGTITVTASGGTGALTYSVDNGATYQAGILFNALSANNYNIKVKDANNCTSTYATNPVAVTEPSVISITSVVKVNVTGCNGNNNGTITVTASGGTGALTYSSDNGVTYQAGNVFNTLIAGNYNIRVKDANACVVTYATNPVVITQPTVISITSVVKTDVNCNGGNDGTITVTASGGTGALTYSKDNGVTYQAAAAFNALIAGNYIIKVKDANGCIATYATNPVVIGQPGGINITTVSQTNVTTCNGGNNGTITISASGGTGALQYSINNGVSWFAFNLFSNLVAGNYNIRVKDANSCQTSYASNPVVITQPTIISITSVVKTDVNTCFGGTNGTITITASGGTGALTYSTDNGVVYQPGNAFNTLIAGSYIIKVKDANGCFMPYGSNPVVIAQPTQVNITAVVKTDVTGCSGNNDGTITVTASGGTGALQYSNDNGATYQAGNIFNTLIAGNYNIMVKDANTCTATYATNPVVVAQPTAISITSVVKTDVTTCNGGNDGTITITANGGTGALTYSIDNGATYQASNIFNTLIAGNYNIRVKDANNCVATYATNPVIITEPTSVSITSVVSTNITGCSSNNNGAITVTASGGTGALTYSIDNGATYQAGNTFNALVAGNYIIKVQDANTCNATYASNPVVLTAPSPVSATLNYTDVTGCSGGSNGTITISAPLGGGGTYEYTINGGTTWTATTNYINLPAATYNVQIRDAANPTCTGILNAALIIIQPGVLSFTYTKVDILCNGVPNGTITVNATGGTPPYKYSKNGGGSYPLSDPINTFIGLNQATYPIKVKDANNCVTANQNVTINQPPDLRITNEQKDDINNLCHGDKTGTIIITASGGVAPIQYSIDNGVTYFPTNNFANLGGGAYRTMIKDANGCVKPGNTNVIDEPSAIKINSLDITNITTCAGNPEGVLAIDASGGTGLLQYTIDLVNFNTIGLFDNLADGSYTISILDDNGCVKDTLGVITAPPPIAITSQVVTNPTCFGNTDGSINIAASGGTGALTYTLKNPAVVSSQATGNFINLIDGNYTVDITDANSCVLTSPLIPLITPNAISYVSQVAKDISCNGLNDGSITIVISGGTAPVSYSISGVAGPYLNNGGVFNGLNAGNTYAVVVKDVNNCSLAGNTLTINEPPALAITSESHTDLTCGGSSDGTLTIVATGGTPGVTYTLLPLNIVNRTGIYTALPAGNYGVIVTDTNSCGPVASSTIAVLQPAPILISSLTLNKTKCNTSSDGSLTVTGSGGTGALSYSIDAGAYQASGNFINLAAGAHPLSIQDASGCKKDTTITILATAKVSIVSSVTNNFCSGSNNGTITVTGSGGTLPYNFTLKPAGIINATGIFNLLGSGTYTVVITDVNNCPSDSTIITPAVLSVDAAIATDVTCGGVNNGTITITASSGTSPYQYSIDNGATWLPTSLFSNLAAGSYPVSVKDNVACVVNFGAVIVNSGSSIIYDSVVIAQVSPCSGNANGSIKVYASGGTGVLQYSNDGGTTYQAGNTFASLGANLYNISVRDAGGCKHDTTAVVIEPTPILISIASVNIISPAKGSITITKTSGGQGFTQYSIDNGLTFQKDNGVFNNLNIGKYYIVVKDSVGCTVNDSTTLVDASTFVVTVNVTDVSCSGTGAITMTSNGISPVQYTIDDGSGPVTQTDNGSFINLAAGNYTIHVADNNSRTFDTAVVIATNPNLSVTVASVNPNLPTLGSITLTPVGGLAPYYFSIDKGVTFQKNNGLFSNLNAGKYYITVKDSLDCTYIDSVTLINISTFIVTVTHTDVSCSGLGTITIVSNGISPVQYSIDNGSGPVIQTDNGNFINLAAGNYAIHVADNISQIFDTTVIIIAIPNLTVNIDVVNSNLPATKGSIDLTPIGGTAPYRFSVDSGLTYQYGNGFFGNLDTGVIYHVMVKDTNDCSFSKDTFIINEVPLDVLVFVDKNVNCNGANTGQISMVVIDAAVVFPVDYSIDNGLTFYSGSDFSNLTAGEYKVVVKDFAGKVHRVKKTITEPLPIQGYFSSTIASCATIANGMAIVDSINGGNPKYHIKWFDNTTNDTLTGLIPGYHTLTITDDSSCVKLDSVLVGGPLPLIGYYTITDASCNGKPDGSIKLDSIRGGKGGYSFVWEAGLKINLLDSTKIDSASVGYHKITLTDSTSCSKLDSVRVKMTYPDITVTSSLIDSALCNNKRTDGKYDGAFHILSLSDSARVKTIVWDNGTSGYKIDSVRAGFYTVTITDTIGCFYTPTFEVPYKKFVQAITSLDDTVCWGTKVKLFGKGGKALAWTKTDSISWFSQKKDTILTNKIFSPLNRFILTASDSVCYDTDTVKVLTYTRQMFTIEATPDTIVSNGNQVTLTVKPDTMQTRFESYVLTPCINLGIATCVSTIPSFTFTPIQDLTYTIEATSTPKYGECIERTSVNIIIAGKPVPFTAFTPNGDGKNDYWEIKDGMLYPDMLCEVFNRWGEIVFQKKGCTENNGTNCKVWNGYRSGVRVPTGTYYYIVHLNDGSPAMTGTLTIVY